VRLIDVVDEAMRWLPASIPGATTIQPGRGSTFRLELREAGAQG